MAKKINFDKILTMIQQSDKIAGFSFIKPNPKKTILDKYLSLAVPINLFVAVILTVSTLYITNFVLINIILLSSVLSVIFGFYAFYLDIRKRKLKDLHDLIDWCKSFYDIEEKFDKNSQTIAKSIVVKMEKNTVKLLKFLKYLAYFDAIGFTCGIAIIGLLLPDNIYGKFVYPTPFYLPFPNQNTWLAWITTMIVQTFGAVSNYQYGLFVFGSMFVFAIHIFYYLQIIKETVEVMKAEMQSIDIKNKANEFKMDKWAKLLSDMICDASEQVSKFNNLYTTYFFCLELGSFGSLFTCGLVFIVVKEQYFYAIGVTVTNALLFVICYMNEKILESFEEIQESLYDTPWYNLSVKQMKVMSILLHCDKIQSGCNALDLNYLTFDRFAIIMKAGYSNLLVLRDLVQK